MDAIDITDSMFSLNNPIIVTFQCDENNIPICIYVGLVILLFIIGMLIYKFYNNKENSGLDCPIGFCNMNDVKETKETQ